MNHMPALRAENQRSCASGMELAMRFVLWMQAQPRVPHYSVIADAWGIHRATAHRWRAAYLAPAGQFDPCARQPSRAETGTTPHSRNHQ